MKQKILYTCEICHRDYADEALAKKCEQSHKLLKNASITGVYLPFTMDATGVPRKITVRFPNDNRLYTYKR